MSQNDRIFDLALTISLDRLADPASAMAEEMGGGVKVPARHLDIVAMVRATGDAEAHVAHLLSQADAIRADSDKRTRLIVGLCPSCYYAGSRMAAAACTTQPCAACGAPQSYGSTATDVLCLPCATEHSLCKRCGGDREMRVRRRKWPVFPNPEVQS